MNGLDELQRRLYQLKHWPVGEGSTFREVHEKSVAAIDLNIKIAELLLAKAGGDSK